MRFLNGIVVGILLTIGAAYMHDRNAGPPAADGTRRELVNWEEFGRSVGDLTDWVQAQFGRLNEQIRRPG